MLIINFFAFLFRSFWCGFTKWALCQLQNKTDHFDHAQNTHSSKKPQGASKGSNFVRKRESGFTNRFRNFTIHSINRNDSNIFLDIFFAALEICPSVVWWFWLYPSLKVPENFVIFVDFLLKQHSKESFIGTYLKPFIIWRSEDWLYFSLNIFLGMHKMTI